MNNFKVGKWLRIEPESYEQYMWGDNIIEIIDVKKNKGRIQYLLKYYYDWEEEMFIFSNPTETWMYEDEIIHTSYNKEEFLKSLFEHPIPGKFK